MFASSEPHTFQGNVACLYQIHNPFPDNPMYFTIYRKTNDSEIAMFFREDHPDGSKEFKTQVYDYPPHNIYAGLDDFGKNGEPFRNSSDIRRFYTFENV
jgi:hypothetical protein